jgi:tetratricopeptide (TPR) repeat protein
MLTKLVRFGKNKDEADEVYYEMALYALNNNTDTTKAIEYLKKSVEASTINTTQKGLSYLRLGKIYFDKELYANAKNNYDSTIAFLPKDHTEFPEAELRQSVLEDLASYVKIIQEQDSLQKLGKLSPKELEKYLADLQAAKDKIEKKKSKLSVEENEGGFLTTTDTKTNYSSNGLWYFYNQELKSNGYKQFKSVWGNRPLEPNWRRSTKSIFETEDNAANNTIVTEEKTKSKDKVIESKLKIPKTPEDFIASDKLIADALYNVGVIFKNKLKNIPKSKQAFDELIQRFPNSEYDAIAHYYQYLIYLEQNLNGLAEKEKNYILENYPFSDVAQKLNNNSNNNTTQQIENANSFYASTYQAYLSGDYNKVLDNKKNCIKKISRRCCISTIRFFRSIGVWQTKRI